MEQNKQISENKAEVKKNDNFAEIGKAEKAKLPEKTGKPGESEIPENKHIVKLSKPYKFEDEGEVSEIDLSCLKDATAETLIKATRVMTMQDEVMAIPENDIRYALFVAAECTRFTYAFYTKLNFQDAIKVKREVMSFFNGAA